MNRINIPIKATAKNRNAYNIRKKDHSLIHLTYFDASLRFTSTWTEISGTNNPWCNSPLGIQIISAISPFRDYGNWTKDRYLLNTSHSKPDMKDIWAAYLKQDFDAYHGLRHLAWNWLYFILSVCVVLNLRVNTNENNFKYIENDNIDQYNRSDNMVIKNVVFV